MNKKILNELSEMKYLFGYKRGVVISEQKSQPSEIDEQPVNTPTTTAPEEDTTTDFYKIKEYYKGGSDTGWTFDATSYIQDTETDYGRFKIKSTKSDDTDCNIIITGGNDADMKNCKSSKGRETNWIDGRWDWGDGKPILTFKGEGITKNAEGYYGDTDTGFIPTKIMNLGARGTSVKKLQGWLVENKYGTAEEIGGNEGCDSRANYENCDGIYGKKTKEAVRKFQEDTDITVDGIFGEETYYASGLNLDESKKRKSLLESESEVETESALSKFESLDKQKKERWKDAIEECINELGLGNKIKRDSKPFIYLAALAVGGIILDIAFLTGMAIVPAIFIGIIEGPMIKKIIKCAREKRKQSKIEKTDNTTEQEPTVQESKKKIVRLTESELLNLIKKAIKEQEEIDDTPIEDEPKLFDYENDIEDEPSLFDDEDDEEDDEDLGFDVEDELGNDDDFQNKMKFRERIKGNKLGSMGIGSGKRWDKESEKEFSPLKPTDLPLNKFLKSKYNKH